MRTFRVDEQGVRAQLKAKRDLLFADFVKDPSNTRLALEIKLVDDQIWERDTNLRSSTPKKSPQSGSIVRQLMSKSF